ncbi:serine protease [Rhodopirellula maiorica SM1]|uniref:Serine protease n=2 Tax=Novipirellula TaxID=2795426 RepID=M5RKI9_9BACT|nr:serine protease [Rhodopirellula maiorica SM1]
MAADFEVQNHNDSGDNSLRWAIEQVNAAGAGTHSITFASNLDPIALASNLPMIVGTGQRITIHGAGNTVSGQNTARLIFVAAGDVTIENITLKQGLAEGGDGGVGQSGGGGGAGAGGALFVNSGANVVIRGVTLDSNAAKGGDGGDTNSAGGGGGGGGYGGNGGSSAGNGGGGGGGFDGNGGGVATGGDGGGGGGGLSGNGGVANLTGGGGGGGVGDGSSSSSSTGGDGDGGAAGGTTGNSGATGTPGGGGAGELGGGGDGATNGGGGGSSFDGDPAGDGGTYGGGGGGGYHSPAGKGGEFGGGGGAGFNAAGKNGGDFAGGGGASTGSTAGSGGFGGGDGGSPYYGGDAGDAMGGAIFVRQGGSLSIVDSSLSGSSLTAGTGGTGGLGNGDNGQTIGTGIYLHTGVTAGIEVGTGSMTLADEIGGTGSLQKTGSGELILSATNTYTGTTSINAGRLAVNGSIAGPTIVGESGELGGSGTINGYVINNGTFAAGNSIGAMNVTGSATFNSGSSTVVEIKPAASPVAGVDNDLITANIAIINGGDVSVQGAAGAYSEGAKYTFLQTHSGVIGTFDSINDDLAFFDAELGYDAYTTFFTLVASSTDFASVGGSGNRQSVGAYVDQNSSGAGGDFKVVLDAFSMLTTPQVQSGLSQLSGDVYGSQSQVTVQGTSQLIGTIGGQLRSGLFTSGGANRGGFASATLSSSPAASDSGSGVALVSYVEASQTPCDVLIAPTCHAVYHWRGWVTGYGLGGSAESDGNAAGIDYGLGGTTFGIERDLGDNVRLGFFGGYVGSSVSADNIHQTVRSDGGNFGSYLTHTSGRHYGIAMGGLQFDDFDSDRTIQVGGLARTANGESDGWQGFAYGERGLNLQLTRSHQWQPFAGLQYVYARQNAFTETGAGSMNLAMAGIDTHSLRSNLGSRLQWQPWASRRGWAITPEIRGSWMHEFLDTTSVVNAQFAGVGGAGFTANGLDLGRDWAIVGGGFAARPSERWELRADYNTQFNDRQVFHVGSGTLSYAW